MCTKNQDTVLFKRLKMQEKGVIKKRTDTVIKDKEANLTQSEQKYYP